MNWCRKERSSKAKDEETRRKKFFANQRQSSSLPSIVRAAYANLPATTSSLCTSDIQDVLGVKKRYFNQASKECPPVNCSFVRLSKPANQLPLSYYRNNEENEGSSKLTGKPGVLRSTPQDESSGVPQTLTDATPPPSGLDSLPPPPVMTPPSGKSKALQCRSSLNPTEESSSDNRDSDENRYVYVFP